MQFKLKDITFAKIVKTLADTKQFEVLDDLVKSKITTEKPAPKKAEDKEQVDRLHEALRAPIKDTPAPKVKKPTPIELAREFVKNNPDAKGTEVKKHLIAKHVNPATARSTAYKVFPKQA